MNHSAKKNISLMASVLAAIALNVSAAQPIPQGAVHIHLTKDAVEIQKILKDVRPVAGQTSLIIKNLCNGFYVTQETLVFHIHDDDFPDAIIIIPKGFKTDFGSIPRIVRFFIEGIGTDRDLVYVLHDWVYGTEYFSWEGVAYKTMLQKSLNRSECDELLLMGCKGVGDGWLVRNTIWVFVRVFGGFVWDNHTPETIQDNKDLLGKSLD